jgi:serine/threonine-protein kinase
MGVVYEAEQIDLGRKVALKVLHPHLAAQRESVLRMQREARAAAALGHPHIVQVTDFQTPDDGPPFLVMERLSGESLRAALDLAGRMDPDRIARIALQVLAALQAAHDAGLVHRDVKPENVFLTRTPATPDFVKLLDFGIAKPTQSAPGEAPLSEIGAALGTPEYMAPEQARGEAIDRRADIFSIGVVLYEAVSGRTGFSDAATAGPATARGVRLPLAKARPDLDPSFCAIVDRATHPERSARFGSADEMAGELSRWLDARARPRAEEKAPAMVQGWAPPAVAARPPPAGARPISGEPRRLVWVVGVSALGAMALLAAMIQAVVKIRETEETIRARGRAPAAQTPMAGPITTQTTMKTRPTTPPATATATGPRDSGSGGAKARVSPKVPFAVNKGDEPRLRSALWSMMERAAQGCFDAMQPPPGRTVRLSVNLTVHPDGAVTGLVVDGDRDAAPCVQERSRGRNVPRGTCDEKECDVVFEVIATW